jgi:hypothetical protein
VVFVAICLVALRNAGQPFVAAVTHLMVAF